MRTATCARAKTPPSDIIDSACMRRGRHSYGVATCLRLRLLDSSLQHDLLDRPIWGARAIAQHIGRSERQCFYLLASGKLDATKLGHIWTSTKRRLNRSLGIEA